MQTWIFGREKAIRKAEPHVSKDEALRRAVEEYCAIYNVVESEGPPKAGPKPASAKRAAVESITDSRVADAVAQAAREASEAARAAGKTEEEVEAAAARAQESVLEVAQQSGLYRPPPPPEQVSLFLQEKERQLEEYVRLGVPMTDDRPRSAGLGPRSQLDVTKLRMLPV